MGLGIRPPPQVLIATVLELVYRLVLGTSALGIVGSWPTCRTLTQNLTNGSVAQLDRAIVFELLINYKLRSAPLETKDVENPLNDES